MANLTGTEKQIAWATEILAEHKPCFDTYYAGAVEKTKRDIENTESLS